MADQPPGYELVMPFVVCRSQGGPYDDGAFVAGFECGALEARLTIGRPASCELYVRTASLPQIDLIAMRHGYQVEAEPWDEDPDEWTHVLLAVAETEVPR